MKSSKIKFSLIVFFLAISFNLFGQRGYIATDTTMTSGVIVKLSNARTNSQICTVKKNDEIIQYTPEQIKEYGIQNKKSYISKSISIDDSTRKVFLEKMEEGNITLYYYRGKKKGTYYIEKDSSIIKLSRDKTNINYFKDVLKAYTTDCNKIFKNFPLLSYNKISLSNFAHIYNNCENKIIPHSKFNLIIGYGLKRYSLMDNYKAYSDLDLDKYNLSGFNSLYGVSVNIPLNVTKYSFSIGFVYQNSSNEFFYPEQGMETEIFIDNKLIDIPLNVKYNFTYSELQPYVKIGSIFTYHFENSITVLQSKLNENYIESSEYDYHKSSNDNLNLTIGVGFDFYLTQRRSLFVELSYKRPVFVDIFYVNEIFNYNSLQLLIGINL